MKSSTSASLENTIDYPLNPFFDSSPDFLCIAGFDGYFKRVNPAICKALEYSEEELLSRPINEFIYPADRKQTSELRAKIHEGWPLLNFENRYVTKSGEIIWLSWNSMPKVDTELVYAIAKNITHMKRQEVERNRLLAEFAAANQRLKQLNYTTAHDLRSPVSNLLSIFSLLNTSMISDPETLQFLEILHVATHELKDTLDGYVDDLQSNDHAKLELTVLNLRDVVRSVEKALDFLFKVSGATLEIDLGAFETITYSRAYLESIFLNLMTNSIKYAHASRKPHIKIKAVVQDGKKQIIFSDNGIGFDANKHKDEIFGMYEKFHDIQDSKGIGLYLVANHMASLGGIVGVESRIDEGTTFTLKFKENFDAN